MLDRKIEKAPIASAVLFLQPMKVCIAEKPSVAREIAHVLGASARKDGYYEGNGYQVTWTFGHLCTLKEPTDYAAPLKRWNIHHLPILPARFGIKLITAKGVEKQFNTIKSLVNAADEVINCGDAGQEGEVIQRWVLQKAGCTAPMKRLWISSLTEEAIRQGFQNLKDASQYDRLYAAGSSRAIGDWLLGINATRLYTLKFGGRGTVLSIGRVQTPTLAMIVERYNEVNNFDSKPFWELKTTYREAVFSATAGKQFEQEKAEALKLQTEGHPFVIASFERKKGKESAPKLFDLTSLQVEGNKKFNLSAEQTLKIAQGLYERKYLTYPRVDTRYLPDDVYAQIPGILQSLRDYSTLVQPLLGESIRKSKNVFNNKKVTDHHAIIPTNQMASGLSGPEQQIYDAVVKRFIANFYPDCQVSRTTVIGHANEVEFRATGRQILDPGWRAVYGKDSSAEEDDTPGKQAADKADSQLLPEFKEGETGPHEPFLEKKETRPPKLYTEATLLRAMETAGKQVEDEELRDAMKENGIGRPSTRANIIETLFRRQYIRKARKSIEPTTTGIQLIGTIKFDLLKSSELTGQWEKRFREVESGNYEVAQLLEEMKTMVTELVEAVKNAEYVRIEVAQEPEKEEKPARKKRAASTAEATCPKCGNGTLLKGSTAYGCSAYKEGCNFRIAIEQHGKKLTDAQAKALVIKKKSPTIKSFTVDGAKKDGVLHLQDDFSVKLEILEAAPLTCPRCKQGTMLKGSNAYGCSRFREGCQLRVPFEFAGKKLTAKQIEALILKGKTPKIKGLNDGQGGNRDGNVTFSPDFQLIIS